MDDLFNLESNKPLRDKINFILPDIPGWCSPEKAELMAGLIVKTTPDLCVEIGVFGGSSLVPQALALKHNSHGLIHGIDPWAKEAALEEMIAKEHKDWWSKVDLEKIRLGCVALIRDLGLTDYVGLLQAKAEAMLSHFANDSIDVLHIDGNHSEALAMKDATLWLPKVKEGGYIFFDDIHWAEALPGEEPKPTTRKTLLHLMENAERVALVGDCMLLRKSPTKFNQMEHFYEQIQGWFDFADVYRQQVDAVVSEGHFVEVGSWLGRSTAYMAVLIANSGKAIKFDAVDTWLGSAEHSPVYSDLLPNLYDKFLANMAPVLDFVRPVRSPSVKAAAAYADGSLDFVFIDASHEYDDVVADIDAWLPKVRPGGFLAGHDYAFSRSAESVTRAVHAKLGNAAGPISRSSWAYLVPALAATAILGAEIKSVDTAPPTVKIVDCEIEQPGSSQGS